MTDANQGAHIETVARRLLGEPNREKSTKHQLRFGTHGSMAVEIGGNKAGTWYDFQDEVGGGVVELVQRETGLANGEVFDWLREMGIEVGPAQTDQRTAATYHYTDHYTDEPGEPLFQVVRYEPKKFVQRRLADDGKPIWGLKAGRYWLGKTGWKLDKGDIPSGAEVRQFPECPRVPYRLPELVQAVAEGKTIYIPEGEKDVDNLRRLGLAATCNPGGAGKWPPGFRRYFRGARVVVLPDNDEPGWKHGQMVVKNLLPATECVRMLDLPGLPDKGDVSDWLKAGGTVEALERLANSVSSVDATAEPAAKADPGQNTDIMAIHANEDAIALVFAARHADTLRYCHDWGMWLRWNGARWERERRRLAFHFARELAREANTEGKATPAKASTAGGVERFAQADPRLATVSDEWDTDQWVLNTPGGTVDLRTGELRPHRREDHITKQTAVTPAPALHDDHPNWTKFLNEATKEDKELQRFLKQMVGYCLTGDIREHALFFIYGPGGNGKGVFLNTIMKVLGDYATTAAMDTFTASHGDKHPTDLAKLRGARMVTASETEEGRAWAESRIKQLTGGDRISARFMRQDFFEFDPTFKLLIVGNHKPILRNVDDAARRRFNIIPFIHKPEQRDLQLEEKLVAEWPAILRWMIDGCLDWQKNGLVRPSSVRTATEEYFNSQDLFGQWLEECCELHPGNKHRSETAADLFASWEAFLESHGEKPESSKSLGDKLSQREVGSERRRHPTSGKPCVFRIGISLIRPPQKGADDE